MEERVFIWNKECFVRTRTKAGAKGTQLYKENVTWINKMKNKGYGFIDIGDDANAIFKSTFYNMEKGQVYGGKK